MTHPGTISDERPGPFDAHLAAAVDHSGDASKPIVSVNAGPRTTTPWLWYAVLAAAFVVICGVTIVVIGKLRFRDAISPSTTAKPVGTPIDPSPNFARPINSPIALEPVGTHTAITNDHVTTEPKAAPCLNKAALDPRGNPILGSDGLPLMMTCDGRSVPRVAPTVSIAGSSGGGEGQAVRPPDRYSGGIIIEPPARVAKPGEVPPDAQEALELLKRVDANQPSFAGRAVAGTSANVAPISGGAQVEGLGGGDTSSRVLLPTARKGASGESTPRHLAGKLESRRWLALRGSQVECNLTMAYVSDIAGEAHCIVARDVFNHDGSIVLIDRGSVANGTFQAVTSLGERRAFVIWDRLVTPMGVTVTLTSKGTDSLGSTGSAAKVDNRWLDRLGMAAAVSLVKDVGTALATRNAASAAGSQMVASSQYFADQVLSQTLAIRPSLYVRQGDAASMVLQADLDFSKVYGDRR